MDITWQRIKEYNHHHGEDFLDQTGEGNVQIFAGWLMHKYPAHSKAILDIVNMRYSEIMSFIELPIFPYHEEYGIESIYLDFAEFCNLTEHLKERVNRHLKGGDLWI